MSDALDKITDPTELGPPRKPRPGKAALRSVEQRVGSLEKMTVAEVMALAERVQRSVNPLYAATNVSVRETLALTELVVSLDAAARQKLLGETS